MRVIDNRLGIPDPALVPYHVMSHLLPKDIIDKYHETGYLATNYGSIGAREAVINKLISDNNSLQNNNELSAENVIITSGTTHAQTCAAQFVKAKYSHISSPEILLVKPGYNLYEPQVKELGFTIHPIKANHLLSLENNNYETELFKLIENNITPQTTLFILTDPDNPTGRIYSNEFKRNVLTLLDRHEQLNIISDTVYSDIKRSKNRINDTLFSLANPTQQERVFEVNALSKTFMPGSRGGWLITSKKNIPPIDKTLDFMYGQLSIGAQLSIISALSQTNSIIPNYFDEINRVYNLRTSYVTDKMNQIDGVTVKKPEGSFYIFINFTNIIDKITAQEIVALSEKQGILLSFGAKFGEPNAIRINAARPTRELKTIMNTIQDIVKSKGVPISSKEVFVPTPDEDTPKFDYKPYKHTLGTIINGKKGPEIQKNASPTYRDTIIDTTYTKSRDTIVNSYVSAIEKRFYSSEVKLAR